jgi:lipid-A-disaccharide synthase
MRILVSAGEASGDLYAARLVEALRRRLPRAGFFGCAGPRMRETGVQGVVDMASLAVVGLAEVVRHLPRIYGEYRRLAAAAEADRPDLAILTDSPDFHLPVAARLKKLGVPVAYFIAPQAWAWREGRVRALRRHVDRLLCIFPFEEDFFRKRGVNATYVGHPLTRLVNPTLSREEFFARHRLPRERRLVALLPGSRAGEIARHLPALADAAKRLYRDRALSFVLASPAGGPPGPFFSERIRGAPIQHIEGETWDAIAHADLALAASGTVTIEAALLGTPMVSFYKVSGVSWIAGRPLVKAPYLTMVNLVAGRPVVPELMQGAMTGPRLAAEAARLLDDTRAREEMRAGLAEVARRLSTGADPIETAADCVLEMRAKDTVHVS